MSEVKVRLAQKPVNEPITFVVDDEAGIGFQGDASSSAGSVIKTTSSLGSITYGLKVKLVDSSGAAIGSGTYYIPLQAES